ncbi:hypothetical protein F5878DRAFT_627675 [Lentinula raphanica]|uniref:Uncharacterized protein n=1 Tax=Lentinula raphanica TaxID=153919 RepID=A0AA38P3G3_9AGAR|nr:hypothetical protein F5878DRAFT_627675 [Lentinula raphanica]
MLLSLPNELLSSIVEHIAYSPTLPDSAHTELASISRFKRTSSELHRLSVANWQLRQICVPFLFADIKIRSAEDAVNMKGQLSLFSQFTKTLVIEFDTYDSDRTEDQIMDQFALAQLEHLSYVELQSFQYSPLLLKTLLAYPTIKSILIRTVPDESLHNDDLSKVIVDTLIYPLSFSNIGNCLKNGMRLARLLLYYGPGLLDEEFGSRKFPGLEEIVILMGSSLSTPFSWLSDLASTNSTLNELNIHRNQLPSLSITLLTSFDNECERQGLKTSFVVEHVNLRKASGQSSHDWDVIAFTMSTNPSASLVNILSLVASSFPKLEILSLDLTKNKEHYDAGALSSVLARCSSLRVVYLKNVFKWLRFESAIEARCFPLSQPTRRATTVTLEVSEVLACAEIALLQLTALLAKQFRTLESFSIDDTGHGRNNRSAERWYLVGWLHVLNFDRKVGGTLQRFTDSMQAWQHTWFESE